MTIFTKKISCSYCTRSTVPHSLLYTFYSTTLIAVHVLQYHIHCCTRSTVPHSLLYTFYSTTLIAVHVLQYHTHCCTRSTVPHSLHRCSYQTILWNFPQVSHYLHLLLKPDRFQFSIDHVETHSIPDSKWNVLRKKGVNTILSLLQNLKNSQRKLQRWHKVELAWLPRWIVKAFWNWEKNKSVKVKLLQ